MYSVFCCSSHENALLAAEQRSSAIVATSNAGYGCFSPPNLFMCELAVFLKFEPKNAEKRFFEFFNFRQIFDRADFFFKAETP